MFGTICWQMEGGEDLNPDLVKTFLMEATQRLKMTVKDKWTSYSIDICQQGETITPVWLVELKETSPSPSVRSYEQEPTTKSILTLAIHLMAIYRLGKIPTQTS